MAPEFLSITVLGSGTSAGVPTIGCHCAVCTSDDPRDKRLRPSVLVRFRERSILIDTTPDFRQQALRAGIPRIDAILFTHSHADHIMGLDDIRPFNFKQGGAIPIYGSADTLTNVQNCFRYIFDNGTAQSMVPRLTPHVFESGPIDLFGLEFQPIPLLHGSQIIYGFRFGAAAYLTDHSDIPPESMAQLTHLDVLFLDALRYKPHPTHSTVERSLQSVAALSPRRAYFTHICHDLSHARTEATLPHHVRLAYDGLEIQAGVNPA
ncbi:MAG: MBL fold metallo-hydrolase [Bryobacteraceae bacterium]